MDSNKIKLIFVLVLSTFAALYLGVSAATAQLETIAWVVGVVTFVSCILLGKKIWLLIPLLGAINLAPAIPSRPDTLLLAQILVISFSTSLFLLRKLPYRLGFTELECWMGLIVICIVQAYGRNPTGLSLFGGDTVGGKPYIIFGITAVSGFLLSGMRVSTSEIRMALRLTIFGGIINFGVSIIGRIFPIFGYWTGTNIAAALGQENTGEAIDAGRATRSSFLSTAASNFSWWLSAFRSPLRACLHPIWAPLILLSVAFAALSGYRSAIIVTGLTYFVGISYRGGFIQVFISGLLGVMLLCLLGFVNLVNPLPPNIQRSLSFLPGTWEERYKRDTEGSTEWRIDMWKEALGSERWIQNKILGDGLGFTAQELIFQKSLQEGEAARRGISGFDRAREGALAAGDYHSTFVSSVRTVGYVGFFIYFLASFRTCIHAHRLIKRYRNTPYYSTCLFFGIPPLVALLWFPFSASTFIQMASATFGSIAMLRILQNNLPQPEEVAASAARKTDDRATSHRKIEAT